VSLIDNSSKPWFARDLTADSLPEPTPLTNTLTLLMPIFSAICPIASATLEAAKGVDFLLPLKPNLPADLWDNAFPN
jgi:hypothetical protein